MFIDQGKVKMQKGKERAGILTGEASSSDGRTDGRTFFFTQTEFLDKPPKSFGGKKVNGGEARER